MAKTEAFLPKRTKLQTIIECAEGLMDEVREAGDDFNRALHKLKQSEPGSERYFGLLCADLAVQADIVRLKAVHAVQEADRLMNYRDRLERAQKKARRNGRDRQRRAS